jgi:hypothetical protein
VVYVPEIPRRPNLTSWNQQVTAVIMSTFDFNHRLLRAD